MIIQLKKVAMVVQKQNEMDTLAFYPWDGGKGDDDAITLRDKFIVARTHAICALCFGAIRVGERVRAQTQVSREQRAVMTFRFCARCCDAMSVAHTDYKPIEHRYVLGMRRSRRRLRQPIRNL